jgi:ribonuclease HI
MGSGHIHYHCLTCPNFDLCDFCAAKGIYCPDDNHSWVERVFKVDNTPILHSNIVLTPAMTRNRLQAKTTQTYPSHSWQAVGEIQFKEKQCFINDFDAREIIIFAAGLEDSGGCGCAFVYGKKRPRLAMRQSLTRNRTISFRLEVKGPDGDQAHALTMDRAELRAAVAALQYKDWSKDASSPAWRSVIIATSCERLYIGTTGHRGVRYWEANDWRLHSIPGVHNARNPAQADSDDHPIHNVRSLVADSDLWKLLLIEVRKLQGQGVNVTFMYVPIEGSGRSWDLTGEAVRAAKSAIDLPEQQDFRTIKYT